jgi:glycosyltransferase involved in cell wall biosynthesis
MREPLSVAVIAKNAEGPLARCLRSVRWADEIVVLDGYSTDGTCDVARNCGAVLLQKGFESFPAERAHVLQHTSHNWVLSLDADMIVPPELAQEIQGLLRSEPPCDGYRMRCLNHFLGRAIRHCSWFDYRFLRLFDKRKGFYDQRTKVLDPFTCTGTIGKLKHYLVHHQTECLEEYLQKMTRLFAPLTAEEYHEKGVRIHWWNMPWYFGCKPFAVFIYKYLCRGGVLDAVLVDPCDLRPPLDGDVGRLEGKVLDNYRSRLLFASPCDGREG